MTPQRLTLKLYNNISRYTFCTMTGLSLQNAVKCLEEIAPLKFAEPWDNVGLLVEPFTPKPVRKIFLTIDLTEIVLMEAIDVKADLIISYHPPIFAPLKQITQKSWKERLISICLEKQIALFSPHTSWDCVKGGICDWLCESLPFKTNNPITCHPENHEYGFGRMLTLKDKISLRDAIAKVRVHTGSRNVHVAIGKDCTLDTTVNDVAVCVGSGGSVLKAVTADLFVTGEMSHHDLLNCTQRNISIILCNHSNTERGYLKEFKDHLQKRLIDHVEVIVTKTDADPLESY